MDTTTTLLIIGGIFVAWLLFGWYLRINLKRDIREALLLSKTCIDDLGFQATDFRIVFLSAWLLSKKGLWLKTYLPVLLSFWVNELCNTNYDTTEGKTEAMRVILACKLGDKAAKSTHSPEHALTWLDVEFIQDQV